MDETWNEQYREDQSGAAGEARGALGNTADQAKRMTERAKEKVFSAGRKAVDTINDRREPAARSLNQAAASLHETADNLPGVRRVSDLAHATADRIQATADYVRDHDVRAVMSDVEGFVRRHPGQSLAAAVVLGFLLGRMFRSNYSA